MDSSGQEDSAVQLRDSLRAMVLGVAEDEGLRDVTLEVSRASAKGDNYLGTILRVRATSRDGGATTSLIIKCMPDEDAWHQRSVVQRFYDNEWFVYGEVLPAFARLQDDVGLREGGGGGERFEGAARFLGRDAPDGDSVALVLEDMSPRGYRLADRLRGLDAVHCSTVLRELGRFHALSFAMRDRRPDLFRRLGAGLQETVFPKGSSENHGATTHFSLVSVRAAELVRKKFPAESKYVRRFQEFADDYLPRMEELVTAEVAEPYAVLCHGDCWSNNYLFKYSEDGETPVAACMLDFQLSRYSSPVTDIAYFLYSCTEADVRRESYASLLDDYYQSFSHFLRKLGSDPEKLFPRSAFEEQVRKFSQFGLGMAVLVLAVVTAPSQDSPALKENDDFMEKRLADDSYINRMSDIVADFVDKDFI